MNRKGVVLAVALWVVVILLIIITSLFTRVINEKNWVRRHLNTVLSFWLAEAGISEAFSRFPDSVLPISINQDQGCPPGGSCSYQAVTNKLPGSLEGVTYYQIDSTGEVILSDGGQIETHLSAIVKIEPPDTSNFQYAIESNGDIIERGNVTIDPDDSKNTYAALNFANLFTATKDQIKNNATYVYNEDNFGEPVSGITWVEVSSGSQLVTAGNLQGDGILVVAGDCRISGTNNFEGIIYVIGGLTITGTVNISGAVFSESETNIDTELMGNVSIKHDQDAISLALEEVGYLSKEITAWQQ